MANHTRLIYIGKGFAPLDKEGQGVILCNVFMRKKTLVAWVFHVLFYLFFSFFPIGFSDGGEISPPTPESKEFGLMRKELLCKRNLFFAAAACLIFLVNGCAATRTLIEKRKLTIETKMSETVFLEPVSPEKRVVYVDVKNTTDKDLPGIESEIKGRIVANGFRLTEDPSEATFILQANILNVGRSDLEEANTMLGTGYEGVVEGAVIGGVIGGAIGGDVDEVNKGTVAGAIAGGVAGFLLDALVTDDLFTMITDIQIRERAREGELVYQTEDTDAPQGTATQTKQTSHVDDVKWKIYRTRIVSVANKANLDFEEAKPLLQAGLVRSIGGIF